MASKFGVAWPQATHMNHLQLYGTYCTVDCFLSVCPSFWSSQKLFIVLFLGTLCHTKMSNMEILSISAHIVGIQVVPMSYYPTCKAWVMTQTKLFIILT